MFEYAIGYFSIGFLVGMIVEIILIAMIKVNKEESGEHTNG